MARTADSLMPRSHIGWPDLCLAALLVALVLISFWPAIGGQFLHYDDNILITDNPNVRLGLTSKNVVWAVTNLDLGYPEPVALLSFMLDVSGFGLDPRPFHLENILLHAANAVLVYVMARRALSGWAKDQAVAPTDKGPCTPGQSGAGDVKFCEGITPRRPGSGNAEMTRGGAMNTAAPAPRWRSASLAALFAVHPLRVESVAWVTERKDLLAGFFGLLSILAYLSYASPLRGKSEVRILRKAGKYLVMLVLFTLSLMAKPMLLALPALLLLMDALLLGRVSRIRVRLDTNDALSSEQKNGIDAAGNPKVAAGPKPLTTASLGDLIPLFAEKLPLFIACAVAAFAGVAGQERLARVESNLPADPRFDVGNRLGNVAISYVRYLWKMVDFRGLAVFYPWPSSWPVWLIAGAVVILAGITGWVVTLRALGRRPWLAFGWAWFLILLAPASGIFRLGSYSIADRYTYLPCLGPLIMLIWSVPVSWLRTIPCRVALGGAGAVVLALLCWDTRMQARTWRDDTSLWEQDIRAVGPNPAAHAYLGVAQAGAGRLNEAVATLRLALAADPTYQMVLLNLGLYENQLGHQAESASYYQRAAALYPDSAEAQRYWGRSLWEQGRPAEAIRCLSRSIKLQPESTNGHIDLGVAYLRVGRRNEAIDQFQRALELDPGNADALFNLASVRQSGR